MNVTRKQIRSALTSYENQVRALGQSTALEMRLYEALAALWKGHLVNKRPATVTTENELRQLAPGSVIVSPLPDTESNVAEKTSDGHWLVTGEERLNSDAEMAAWADAPFTVLRHGYGDSDA